MKTFGKVLAMVLAMTMAFSFVSFAAYSDVPSDASYKDAVDLLTSINILKGDDKGLFNPDATITRAEFAAVVCRTLGLESAAAGSMAAIFTDVPVDNWANGYIALAYQAKIINGYGDGNFGPSDPVLYEQAVKMLVNAIGYQPKAEALGGYPTGYVVVANQEGMTVGVNGKIGDPAKRSAVAKLAYNALSIKMLVQDSWNVYNPTYEESDDTLLSSKLKIAKVEGTITEVNFKRDSIDDTKFRIESGKGDSAFVDTTDSDLSVAGVVSLKTGGIDVKSFQEFYCIAYIDTAADDYTLKALVPKSSKNSTETITSSQYDSYDPAANVVKYYKDSTSSSLTNIDLAAGFKVYVNGALKAVTDFAAELDNSTEIKFLDNADTSKYDVVFLKQYTTMVVGDIYDKTYKIYASSSSNAIQGPVLQVILDPEETESAFDIFDDQGNKLTFSDIKANDVLSLAYTKKAGTDANPTYEYLEVVVSKATITGTVTETSTDKNETTYSIGGKFYKLAASGSLSIGDEGTFGITKFGKIALKSIEATTSGNFGFVIDISPSTSTTFSKSVEALILTDKGEAVVSPLATSVRIDASNLTTAGYLTNYTLAQDFRTVKPADYVNGTTLSAPLVDYKGMMVAYTMNTANEITKLAARYKNMGNDYKFTTDTAALYKALSGKLGSYYINDKTNLVKYSKDFNSVAATAAAEKTDKENFALVTSAALVDDSAYDCQIIYDANSREVKFGFINNFQGTVDPASKPVVITAVGQTKDVDSNDVSRITGFQGLDEVTFTTNVDIEYFDFANNALNTYTPAKGDVIQYTKNSAGEADVVRVLFKANVLDPAVPAIPGFTATVANGALTASYKFSTTAVDNKETFTLGTKKLQGFGYVGKLVDASTSFVTFLTDDATNANDDIDLRNTVVYRVNKTGSVIKAQQASIGDAETLKNNGANITDSGNANYFSAAAKTATDDQVFVYRYDGATLAVVIVDVENDNK